MTRALLVIDMQRGFDDLGFWGPTANPDCEAHVGALVDRWAADGEPVVVVRHDSRSEGSPLHPASPGNALVDVVAAWLGERGIRELVICGIQTNMCVETTARMGGNLGYDVTVVLDATRTFDLSAEVPGLGTVTRTAGELMADTALVLQQGGFARIARTADLV